MATAARTATAGDHAGLLDKERIIAPADYNRCNCNSANICSPENVRRGRCLATLLAAPYGARKDDLA